VGGLGAKRVWSLGIRFEWVDWSYGFTLRFTLVSRLGLVVENDPPSQVEALTIGRLRIRAGRAGVLKKTLTKSGNESEIQLNTWTSSQ
jgi:hypothetical protein